MYSQCPECLTRFRVTAAALRAAHGTVRCGRCGSAFDALPRLSDTIQDPVPESGPAQPAVLGLLPGDAAMSVATAAGLLAPNEGSGVSEFHFSADDIESVFMDARDWQSRFGAASSPGDRAGKLGDTSTTELDQLVDESLSRDPGPGDADSAGDAHESEVWVHEPESVEDITLEGERIEIEGFAGFEEDFLEREIAKEIEEQQRAESTGAQRTLAPPDDVFADDAIAMEGLEPLHDPDSTDQFRVVSAVPDSAYPDDAADDRTGEFTDDGPSDDEPPAAYRALDPDAFVPVPAMPAAVAAAAAGLAAPSPAAPVDAPPTDETKPAEQQPAVTPMRATWRRFPEPEADPEHDALLAEELAAAAGARRAAWTWGLGAFLLALLLASQLVHHYRLQLARDARIGPPLRELYSRLGQPLPPNWDLTAFVLRQWGASDTALTATGALSVRASISNGAAFAQPLPLLRLELEDRFGGTVARRDFEPAEYLKDAAQAGRLLNAGAATEAELVIEGATAEAVGYRLDVCLREQSGTVRCAQGTASASAADQAAR
jgi:predicted Zn finger-like uncharacterized protein